MNCITEYSFIFELVKTSTSIKQYLKLAPLFLLGCLLSQAAIGAEGGDAWVTKHRQSERSFSSTIYDKNDAPVKFFNGFAVGASAGLGLFHGDLADYDVFGPFENFSTYYNFAWRIYAKRDLKWGLGVQAHFEAGTLSGGRIPGKQSPKINFESEYRTFALMATYDVLGELFRKDREKQSKTYLTAEVGLGLTFFRAATFWTGDDQRVRDFIGYTVTDQNPPTQRFVLDERASPAVALVIPVGFTFGYRINYKTDVTFSYTLNNLMTDELDAWSRDWSARDKYSYFGVGLRYNFNRETSDYPKKKPKEEKPDPADEKDRKWKLFGSSKEDVKPNEVNIDGPLQSRMGNTVDPALENAELEEVKMKMFELQLKLFEMQYLLGGGKVKTE